MSSLYFHSEEIEFELSNRQEHVDWIFSFINSRGFQVGELNYVFCSDDYLLEINRAHLNHDYYTDIITFDYVDEKVLNGDIFISIDRVEDNAKSFSVTFADELRRVIAHGALHLMGLNDKSPVEQREMREAEDQALELYKGLKTS